MSVRWAPALSLLSLLASACTAFPDIPAGVCGNAVIEAPEDCDTFPGQPGLVCRRKDEDEACHWDCSPRDGQPGACPNGWGCDSKFVCRQPGGGFESPTPALDVGAWSLSAADFDGDRRTDVMSSEPLDSLGQTRVRFFYFDEQGELADTRQFPTLLISPTIKELSGDQRADVAFAHIGLGVMLGRADRSWVPETFSTYRVERSQVRVVAASNNHIQFGSPILPLIGNPATATAAASAGFYVVDPITAQLEPRARVARSISELVGDPVSGNIVEDPQTSPCFEPIVAVRGASHFSMFGICDRDEFGAISWKAKFEQQDVALKPPAAIDSAPLIVDLNGDGHLDVLIGARGKAYVSYGDGTALAAAIPYVLSFVGTQATEEIPMPLAAGDLTGDGAPDFAFADQVYVSTSDAHGLPVYAAASHPGRVWTAAKILDFNGNGKPDLVAASDSSLNLEFYNGTGTPFVSGTLISTSAPVQFLASGDFDGDLITDLAFIEKAPPGQVKSPLKIAFGAASGLPGAPVTVAQLNQPEALSSYDDKSISSLVVVSNAIVDGVPGGELTFLDGSGDRVPFAPFELTEFVAKHNIQNSNAVAVAAGNFSTQRGDLLAIGLPPTDLLNDGARPAQPWLLPMVETAGTYTRRLPADLDARLNPFSFSSENLEAANFASSSADLDGDGLEEAIFAMPAGARRDHCGLVTFGATGSGADPALVIAHEPLVLDEACLDPRVQAVDADADGAIDLVLLTGQVAAPGRKLYVLWNDHHGGFSSADSTVVSGADSPQAFSVLPGTPDGPWAPARPFGFAYVTRDKAQFVSSAGAREFLPPVSLLDDLNGGTGIAAADVNGDRVSDLVIAESGKLRVLKAQLKVP